MSRVSKISDFCSLINDCLRFLRFQRQEEEEAVYLTKQEERDLLISLSKVSTEIQHATSALRDSNETEINQKDEKCTAASTLHRNDHNCLIKILADLMFVLTVKSPFVQHLACNTVVAVSDFVAVLGNEWDTFLRLLCVCFERAIANASGYSTTCSITGDDKDSYCKLKSRLTNAKWPTAAGIVRILHNVLKFLKHECDDDQLIEVYLGSVGSSLCNMNWDFMNEIHVGQSSETWDIAGASLFGNAGEMERQVLFLGNLVQFLCSLVEQSSDVEVEVNVGSQEQNPILHMVISLVPKLLCSCLGKRGAYVKISLSHYFRHKLLMLMLRLTYRICLDCSTMVSWLQHLHNYFKELLLKPIIEPESGQNEFLEGSPFILSLYYEGHHDHSLHLQRQAILLFLRCCFGLISMTGENTKECACATLNSCLHFDSVADLDCCSRKKGFLELHKWLQGHLPTDKFVDHEIYMEKCAGFASSFLQLFLHEDDALFKVLLQLLNVPSYAGKQLHGEEWAFQDGKHDIIFHVSSLFNPVYLFHLFLAKLCYDHQVLLDYLISKDTGLICAQYLLRCLRVICNSWDLFVSFSIDGSSINQSSCKKRKFLLDGTDSLSEPSVVHVKGVPSSDGEKRKRNINCREHYKINRQLFMEAKNCLLSLKDSLESLHQKNLFPYNPEVLLTRLRNFQDLCFNQKRYGL